MNAAVCPRCDRFVTLDDNDVRLDGRTYHRECGFIEAAVKGFHHVRASHKWQFGVCLGVYDIPLHPPSMRVCQEAGLLHCETDNSHINASTFAALKYWHQPSGANPMKTSRTCEGWDIDRIMRRLIGMLEATTMAYDHMEHRKARDMYDYLLFHLFGVNYTLDILIPGGMVEVAQCAALCCNLALKTLYAVHNPEASKKVFSKMGHDMSKAWDRLDGERGVLIGIMRAMPMFPLEDVDDERVRNMLRESADFDELRWSDGWSTNPFALSALTHLRLAWATYIRCHELVEYDPISPQLYRHITTDGAKATRLDFTEVRELHRPATHQLFDTNNQQGYPADDSSFTPDWLRLAKEISEMDRTDDLFKSNYGLLHRADGAYVSGSTVNVLRRWVVQEMVATRRFGRPSLETTLGHTMGLATILCGRLEAITGDYAHSAHLIEAYTLDGLPAPHYFGGELMLYTQSAVFACEQAIKWLYSISHPEAPLSVYKEMGRDGHDVLEAWKHIPEHHDEILKIFHAMPLFQGDGDLHEREHVSSERMLELLGRFGTTYSDARYGTTDPAKEGRGVQVDYRICLHLAWAVYLYGMMNLPINNDSSLPTAVDTA